MQRKKRLSRKLLKTVILISFASFILVGSSCHYEPRLVPVADVLKPGPEVEIIGFTDDGHVIVNEAYILWVEALKDEIKRLRAKLEE